MRRTRENQVATLRKGVRYSLDLFTLNRRFSMPTIRPFIAFCATLLLAACATTTESQPPAAESAVPQIVPNEAAVATNYRLGEGDVIGIQVFDEPDLTMQARVGASGVINYSYLGNVQVSGRSPAEIESELAEALAGGYLVNPSVNVTVVEYRPFFINGEVRSPGGYAYQPGMTVEKAVALAGGLTDRASTRRISLQRASRAEDGQTRASLADPVGPGDIIQIDEGFF